MSSGEALLHVLVLTIAMSISLEFRITNVPSRVKSMLTIDPDT